jgi:hypothetical protein
VLIVFLKNQRDPVRRIISVERLINKFSERSWGLLAYACTPAAVASPETAISGELVGKLHE